MTNYEKLVALVRWARDARESIEGEFGSGASYAQLLEAGDEEALMIEAAAELITPERSIHPPYDH